MAERKKPDEQIAHLVDDNNVEDVLCVRKIAQLMAQSCEYNHYTTTCV
ncbi:MAG: hypothetical protein AB1489_23545 [Acidobacteriota bacterium]